MALHKNISRRFIGSNRSAPCYESYPWPEFWGVGYYFQRIRLKLGCLGCSTWIFVRNRTCAGVMSSLWTRGSCTSPRAVWSYKGWCRIHLISAISSYLSCPLRGLFIEEGTLNRGTTGLLRDTPSRRARTEAGSLERSFSGMKQALVRARSNRRPLLRFWGNDEISA